MSVLIMIELAPYKLYLQLHNNSGTCSTMQITKDWLLQHKRQKTKSSTGNFHAFSSIPPTNQAYFYTLQLLKSFAMSQSVLDAVFIPLGRPSHALPQLPAGRPANNFPVVMTSQGAPPRTFPNSPVVVKDCFRRCGNAAHCGGGRGSQGDDCLPMHG